MKHTTAVNMAKPRNITLPRALTSGPRPKSFAALPHASNTKLKLSQPKIAYTRGEKRFRSAISRVNKHATPPLKAAGTFQAKEPKGTAAANTGQSNPCPDKYATYSACKTNSVAYSTNS